MTMRTFLSELDRLAETWPLLLDQEVYIVLWDDPDGVSVPLGAVRHTGDGIDLVVGDQP